MATPGSPPVPHVGGPVIGSGCLTVFIEGQPAARAGDPCSCVGEPDMIVKGSIGVFIGGLPAARMGDGTAHGGVVISGCVTVLIGEVINGKSEAIDQAIKLSILLLENKIRLLEQNDPETLKAFKKWFGREDEEAKRVIMERMRRVLAVSKRLSLENFKDKSIDQKQVELFAEVYETDRLHTIYINHMFWEAKSEGKGSKAGTIIHELSHFEDIGNTKDYAYGKLCLGLAKNYPNDALNNAESFEYFMVC
jgi:uncharacterized Zn-binding protein involved in type VI secretion